jgi:hypothetical protein
VEESFVLSVPYRNTVLEFPAVLRVFARTHKIALMIDELEVLFEPDEERNYRAVLSPEDAAKGKINVELLKAIAVTLEEAFKD